MVPFQFFQEPWPSQRLAAASSVPDFVGNYDSVGNREYVGNYEFDEESFEEIVQEDYGFLYYNNNPARKPLSS